MHLDDCIALLKACRAELLDVGGCMATIAAIDLAAAQPSKTNVLHALRMVAATIPRIDDEDGKVPLHVSVDYAIGTFGIIRHD